MNRPHSGISPRELHFSKYPERNADYVKGQEDGRKSTENVRSRLKNGYPTNNTPQNRPSVIWHVTSNKEPKFSSPYSMPYKPATHHQTSHHLNLARTTNAYQNNGLNQHIAGAMAYKRRGEESKVTNQHIAGAMAYKRPGYRLLSQDCYAQNGYAGNRKDNSSYTQSSRDENEMLREAYVDGVQPLWYREQRKKDDHNMHTFQGLHGRDLLGGDEEKANGRLKLYEEEWKNMDATMRAHFASLYDTYPRPLIPQKQMNESQQGWTRGVPHGFSPEYGVKTDSLNQENTAQLSLSLKHEKSTERQTIHVEKCERDPKENGKHEVGVAARDTNDVNGATPRDKHVTDHALEPNSIKIQKQDGEEITKNRERNARCSICDKVFKRSHYLKSHMMVHSGSKPHKCSYCKRSFSQVGNRNAHERLHTGMLPYGCDLCDRRFNFISLKRFHMKIHLKPLKDST